MSQAIVDPAELRRFAAYLIQSREDILARKRSVQARFDNLHQTWRDQKHTRFAEDLTLQMQQLDRYLDLCDQLAAYLQKKAIIIQRYLDRQSYH